MSSPIIVVVVFMLLIVLDAIPRCPRTHCPVRRTAPNIRNIINSPRFKQATDVNGVLPNNIPDTFNTPSISPVEDFVAWAKPLYLNELSEKDDCVEFLVKPLDIGGGIISGINYWFILDKHYSDLDDIDEEYNICYEEVEELSDEVICYEEVKEFSDEVICECNVDDIKNDLIERLIQIDCIG